jgi:hypothetical protein
VFQEVIRRMTVVGIHRDTDAGGDPTLVDADLHRLDDEPQQLAGYSCGNLPIGDVGCEESKFVPIEPGKHIGRADMAI